MTPDKGTGSEEDNHRAHEGQKQCTSGPEGKTEATNQRKNVTRNLPPDSQQM